MRLRNRVLPGKVILIRVADDHEILVAFLLDGKLLDTISLCYGWSFGMPMLERMFNNWPDAVVRLDSRPMIARCSCATCTPTDAVVVN